MNETMMLLVPEEIVKKALQKSGAQVRIACMSFPGTGIMGLFGTIDPADGCFAVFNEPDLQEEELLKEAVNAMHPAVWRLSDLLPEAPDDVSVYVVSNQDNYYGASAIFHPVVQAALTKLFPDGYWLIPSSQHEFLAVPKCDNPQYLQHLLEINKEINRDVVGSDEVLTDGILELKNGTLVPAKLPEYKIWL